MNIWQIFFILILVAFVFDEVEGAELAVVGDVEVFCYDAGELADMNASIDKKLDRAYGQGQMDAAYQLGKDLKEFCDRSPDGAVVMEAPDGVKLVCRK